MRYGKEEKAKLLEGWKQSGKSVRAYVKENGLVRRTKVRGHSTNG